MRWLGEQLAGDGHTVLGVRLAGHGTCPEDMSGTRWPDWYAGVLENYQRLRDDFRSGSRSHGSKRKHGRRGTRNCARADAGECEGGRGPGECCDQATARARAAHLSFAAGGGRSFFAAVAAPARPGM